MMKDLNTLLAAKDLRGRPITYGVDRRTPWIEFSEKGDRWVLFGNCETNLQRMKQEIRNRGIQVVELFHALLSETPAPAL